MLEPDSPSGGEIGNGERQRAENRLSTGLRGKILLLLSLLAAGSVSAQDGSVTACSGCDAISKQNAAIAAAPPWDGIYNVYVTDGDNRSVEKYEVTRENEPGLSLTEASLVEIEPAVSTFVSDYWAMLDTLAKGIDVPPETAPSLPDFLGNPAVSGGTRHLLGTQLASLMSFPGNWSILFSQFVGGRVAALPAQGIIVTLRFPDGGTVLVELTVGIDVSTNTVVITEMATVPGSAFLNGVPYPTEAAGFGGYERSGAENMRTIEDLVRLARMYGIPVTCAITSSTPRIKCDTNGNCIMEVVGSCD